MNELDLSVVVPAYRAEGSLVELVDRLAGVLRECDLSFEIVLVNDASPDGTWKVIQELSAGRNYVLGIDLLSNHGQARATLCGLSYARGWLVATMDDDLEHLPEELPRLLEALDTHGEWDAVVGSWVRSGRVWRRLGSWIHEYVDRLAHGTPRGYRHSTFRVMRRPVVDALLAAQTRTPVLSPMLREIAGEVQNIPVRHGRRLYGSSGFQPLHGLRSVMTNFLQASTLPLRALSALGVLCALVALFVSAVLVGRWLAGVQTPPGWASSLLAVVFFGGMSLLGLGILGEYLSLIMREVRGAPRWSVRQETGTRASGSQSSVAAVRNVSDTRSISDGLKEL